ncbi:GNAT family N-acetyltransferase [Synechococcus sp. GreenBA-s]|nr:GNAT family N-acetyltransferase [Synechococcus sp. GreenBA-s]
MALHSADPDSRPEAAALRLIRHAPGAPALRLGLGAGWRPVGAIGQLRALLNDHSFWAAGRSAGDLRRMLRHSQAAVSAWDGRQLVGFGRASSDGVYRAALWDVVVAEAYQGQGLGRELVTLLLEAPLLRGVERTYLMTTNSAGFYRQLGFAEMPSQKLLLRQQIKKTG